MILKFTPALVLLIHIFCAQEVLFPKRDGYMLTLNLTATCEQIMPDADFANAAGVYPVVLTWRENAAPAYYVFRSSSPKNLFKKITPIPVRDARFIDTDTDPGITYYYKIGIPDERGQLQFTPPVRGYGALTPEQFFREYQRTLLRSHKKMTYRNKSSNWDKIGSETIAGDVSGTVFYNTNVDLLSMGARIYIAYNDYADFAREDGTAYMRLNGNSDTLVKNFGKSGNMSGTVTVSGMYTGSVVYNDILIQNSDSAGGFYTVTSSILPPKRLPWDFE